MSSSVSSKTLRSACGSEAVSAAVVSVVTLGEAIGDIEVSSAVGVKSSIGVNSAVADNGLTGLFVGKNSASCIASTPPASRSSRAAASCGVKNIGPCGGCLKCAGVGTSMNAISSDAGLSVSGASIACSSNSSSCAPTEAMAVDCRPKQYQYKTQTLTASARKHLLRMMTTIILTLHGLLCISPAVHWVWLTPDRWVTSSPVAARVAQAGHTPQGPLMQIVPVPKARSVDTTHTLCTRTNVSLLDGGRQGAGF